MGGTATGGGDVQLKLKELIISAFVPREESEKVKQAAIWDDEHECWVLERLRKDVPEKSAKAKRPVSASGLKRPMSDYAKIASAMGDQVGGSVRSLYRPVPALISRLSATDPSNTLSTVLSSCCSLRQNVRCGGSMYPPPPR